jgi:hypothetical protein
MLAIWSDLPLALAREILAVFIRTLFFIGVKNPAAFTDWRRSAIAAFRAVQAF